MKSTTLHGVEVRCPEGMDFDLFEKAMHYDLTDVRAYLKDADGLTDTYARELEVAWKQFLIAIYMNKGQEIIITGPLDVFAHAHVLHTVSYGKFCGMLDMKVHHFPTHSDVERSNLLTTLQNQTIPYLKSLFGSEGLNQDIFDENSPICGSCGFGCVTDEGLALA